MGQVRVGAETFRSGAFRRCHSGRNGFNRRVLTGVSEHHNYLGEIFAARLMLDEGVVATEACRVCTAARPENQLAPFFEFLRQHLGDRR